MSSAGHCGVCGRDGGHGRAAVDARPQVRRPHGGGDLPSRAGIWRGAVLSSAGAGVAALPLLPLSASGKGVLGMVQVTLDRGCLSCGLNRA